MTSLAVIHIGIDPVLHFGGLGVHWYGIMYAVAFYVAWKVAVVPHLRPRGVSEDRIEVLLAWTIVAGLLGARLYYDLQSGFLNYLTHPVDLIAVWKGGMAFFGAIIGGVVAIWFLAKRERISFWLVFDAAVLFACVGQPIGRIGNVINGDILGGYAPNLPWATAYTNPNAILQPGFQLNIPYQPAAVYEALGTLGILVILLLVRRRGVRTGVLSLTYLPLYAISQLIIFHWRASEPAIFLGLKQAQWTAIGVLLLGAPLAYLLWRRGVGAAPSSKPAARDGTVEPSPLGSTV
jgi:phosphatidylglycerol:prolipoprotein diacylglycerol transferase